MKVHLLDPARSFAPGETWQEGQADLVQDLELEVLYAAMAAGDPFLLEVARAVVPQSLPDPATILYRQEVLAYCLQHPDVVRTLYDIAGRALEGEKKAHFGLLARSPGSVLYTALSAMEGFLDRLVELREFVQRHGGDFASEGWRRFFAMVREELTDAFFAAVRQQLKTLRFHDGVLVRARLGRGNKGEGYVLLDPPHPTKPWLRRLLAGGARGFAFTVPERDESGLQALAEIRGRAINEVANALAQAVEHILAFFASLRFELAFYLGCLNLERRLREIGVPVSFPKPVLEERPRFRGEELYDVSLAIGVGVPPVASDVDADDKRLVFVTGANQGGKSTFLRSVGQAQVMMQCGMFVGAKALVADIREGIFTHFRRREDDTLERGRLDEELRRMRAIVDHLGPRSLLLLNESFQSTNEREGAAIAEGIVDTVTSFGVKVFFVTHLFELARSFAEQRRKDVLFLRAERLSDGRRTFRMVEGEPLPTSFARDLFQEVFQEALPVEHEG